MWLYFGENAPTQGQICIDVQIQKRHNVNYSMISNSRMNRKLCVCVYVCVIACLRGQASRRLCASFTKETKFWQSMTCTAPPWTSSTCSSASLSRMRYVQKKWQKILSIHDINNYVKGQLKGQLFPFLQVKVTILRRPGCPPLHSPNGHCFDWMQTKHESYFRNMLVCTMYWLPYKQTVFSPGCRQFLLIYHSKVYLIQTSRGS